MPISAPAPAYQQIEQWQTKWETFQQDPLSWSDWDGYSSPSATIGNTGWSRPENDQIGANSGTQASYGIPHGPELSIPETPAEASSDSDSARGSGFSTYA